MDLAIVPAAIRPANGVKACECSVAPSTEGKGALAIAPTTVGDLATLLIWGPEGETALDLATRVRGVLDRFLAKDEGRDYPLVRIARLPTNRACGGRADLARFLVRFDQECFAKVYTTPPHGATKCCPPVITIFARVGDAQQIVMSRFERYPLPVHAAVYRECQVAASPSIFVGLKHDPRLGEWAHALPRDSDPLPWLRGTRNMAFLYLYFLCLIRHDIRIPHSALGGTWEPRKHHAPNPERLWRLFGLAARDIPAANGLTIPPTYNDYRTRTETPAAAGRPAKGVSGAECDTAAASLRETFPHLAPQIERWRIRCHADGPGRQTLHFRVAHPDDRVDWARDFFFSLMDYGSNHFAAAAAGKRAYVHSIGQTIPTATLLPLLRIRQQIDIVSAYLSVIILEVLGRSGAAPSSLAALREQLLDGATAPHRLPGVGTSPTAGNALRPFRIVQGRWIAQLAEAQSSLIPAVRDRMVEGILAFPIGRRPNV
ncbi:MAG: hypothetical protein HY543_11465 [Deltaproteobacteria bacterium]|nr:hypothetical protein [Deltaproteobacteria bacterium]